MVSKSTTSTISYLKSPALLLTGILALALILRIWNLDFGLPVRTHPDEAAYVVSSLKLASGELRIAYPFLSPNMHQVILAFSYGVMFVVGKLIGIYSSSAEFAQSYLTIMTPFFVLGRLNSVIPSVMTVGLTYLVGRKLMNTTGGLVAAALLAVSFIDVRHARFIEPYSLISLFIMSSLYMALFFDNSKRKRYLYLSSFFAGASIALRFSVAPVLLIPGAALLLSVSTKNLQDLIRTTFAVGLSTLGGFCFGYPGVILGLDSILAAVNLYSGFASGQTGFEGFRMHNEPNSWLYYLQMFVLGLGMPFLLATVVGIMIALWQKQRTWVLVLPFPVIYFLLLGTSQMAFVRYTVVLMPFFALLVALTLVSAKKLTEKTNNAWVKLAPTLLFVTFVFIPLSNTIKQNILLGKLDTRISSKIWIEDHISPGARIALQWSTPILATPEKPEPASRHIYDAVRIDPLRNKPDYYSYQYYVDNGFEYVVMSSYIYRLERVNQVEEEQRQAFHSALKNNAQLIAEFHPAKDSMEIPFNFEELYSPMVSLWQRDWPGPTIKIYKISPYLSETTSSTD